MGQGVGATATRAKLDVAGRAVTIASPAGFCIDPESVTSSAEGAFVLMSDCGLMGKGDRKGTPVGAAMTASVSSGGFAGEGDTAAGSLEDLAEFAETREGRTVLGRSGQPDRVRILNTQLRAASSTSSSRTAARSRSPASSASSGAPSSR